MSKFEKQRVYMREYSKRNRATLRAKSLAYHHLNKEKINKRQRSYYAMNREAILLSNKLSYEKNKERNQQKGREYHYKNRDKILIKSRARWNERKEIYNKKRRLRKHRLSVDEFNSMQTAQNFCCAICKEPSELVIDHNHETGKVRALLCDTCNRALGMLGESVARLESCIEYLEKHGSYQKKRERGASKITVPQ